MMSNAEFFGSLVLALLLFAGMIGVPIWVQRRGEKEQRLQQAQAARRSKPKQQQALEITFFKPAAPRQSAYKPKPDKYTVYDAADACIALAEALERKANHEPDDIKKQRMLAQAAAQRLKAEKLAIQAG